MKTTKQYFFISMITALCGMLLYSWHKEWILFKFPSAQTLNPQSIPSKNLKKKLTLYYWNADKWNKESTEIIWCESDTAKTLEYITNSWLSLLDEEQIMQKKVVLQTSLITQSNYAYLSFDRYPFNKEQLTYEKLQWIEGLIKTIRESNIKLQGIYFLVQHQKLIDSHLDFSNAWPLTGFNNSD